MKFKTSFYEHGTLMKKHKKIKYNYLHKAFAIDLLALLSLIFSCVLSYNTPLKWVTMLFFGHFKTIQRIMANFENLIDLGDYFDLVSVMLKLLFIAHIYACVWHYVAFIQETTTNQTWIAAKNLIDADWKIRYVYASYWALTTMVTVGYGDITPQNIYEIGFCIFTLVSGSLVSGYCLNKIGKSLSQIDERDRELKSFLFFLKVLGSFFIRTNIRIMDNYMRQHNINSDLKARALKYLEFTWKLERKHMEKQQELLEQLPEHLKKEILFESNGKSLSLFPILKNNFRQEILDKLSFSLKTTQYSPKEIIYSVYKKKPFL